MHDALKGFPGEWQGVHGHGELFWGVTDTPSRKEAQTSFPLSSWSAPYQLEHTSIPQLVTSSMLTNVHGISRQTLDYLTWIIWKHGLYLICTLGLKQLVHFAEVLWKYMLLWEFHWLNWLCVITIALSGREIERSPQGTENGERLTFKMKVSS